MADSLAALRALRRLPRPPISPPAARAVACLRLDLPGAKGREQPLHGSCYRIGRDRASDIVVDHAAVSRRHALLERHGSHWLLSDLGSTNGLWWRGQRVQRLLLRDGDRIGFAPDKPTAVGGSAESGRAESGAADASLPTLRFLEPEDPRLSRMLRFSGIALASITGGGLLLLAVSMLQMPLRGSLATVRGPLLLYDGDDRPIASAQDLRHHELARLHEYPAVLIHALLASEDNRFWWHPGVDPIGMARALMVNLIGGRIVEGGSTLTQQLARSLYPQQVGEGETLARKWRELLVALQLEARFSKRDLLLSYLNRVYLGSGWGFEDGSRRFFAKPAARLQLEEAALLVGMLPSPNGHDPCLYPRSALAARNRVLDKMAATARISADQARSARRRPIQLAGTACRSNERRAAPFYSDQVRRDLDNLVGAEVATEGNFLIDTHLDPELQTLVERVLRERIDANRSRGVSQGAVVVIDSRTGGVLAIAGGRDYRQSQFNRASMALRQPGSTFKLVPYVLALERGKRPGDTVDCGPLRWRGQFFESACGGRISLRTALAASSNTAALRLARDIGLEAVVQKARELGISSPLAPVPGLPLGQSEVTLLELTAAYAAVANDGIWNPPTTIRRLSDAEVCPSAFTPSAGGATPAEAQATPSSRGATTAAKSRSAVADAADCRAGSGQRAIGGGGRRVMKSSTARDLRSMLESVVSGGTGTAAWVGGGSGGKTGTTNDARDLLFVGSMPSRHWTMGVWLGNDDNSPSAATSALAASLWAEIIRVTSPSD
jgi:penicillin-binding protein 1A